MQQWQPTQSALAAFAERVRIESISGSGGSDWRPPQPQPHPTAAARAAAAPPPPATTATATATARSNGEWSVRGRTGKNGRARVRRSGPRVAAG